jgi:hypothetical protein
VIEQAVLDGIAQRFDDWSDIGAFTQRVNEVLWDLHSQDSGNAAEIEKLLQEVDTKITNVRTAIEQGLDDVGWAKNRLRELTAQRAELADRQARTSTPAELPELDTATVSAYRRKFRDLLKHGSNREVRELVRCFVSGMTLVPAQVESEKTNEPVAHQIEIRFKAMPAQFVRGLGAGRGFEPLTFGL